MKNNFTQTFISEVIVVEGKTDTQKLKQLFGPQIRTIETNGLALNSQTIALIQQVNSQQGIIIFTDPDGPGKKIREMLNEQLSGEVKNAFITKKAVAKDSKKVGLAEADDQAIIDALTNLITFKKTPSSLSWSDYLKNDFFLKENRVKLCEHFNFDPQMSSKSLFKWLNMLDLNTQQLKTILASGDINNG